MSKSARLGHKQEEMQNRIVMFYMRRIKVNKNVNPSHSHYQQVQRSV